MSRICQPYRRGNTLSHKHGLFSLSARKNEASQWRTNATLDLEIFQGKFRPATPGIDSRYKIVILNNRDEFWERPTAPAAFWEDIDPNILAGRDLVRGGTWFGITRTGRFACLTNYRVPKHKLQLDKKSRGELTSHFLAGIMTPEEYTTEISSHLDEYDGFNLVVGDLIGGDFWCVSNRDPERPHPFRLEKGRLYGLSNATLDVPWPKVVRGKTRMIELLSRDPRVEDEDQLISDLLDVLSDTERPADEHLPDTGVGIDLERCYSSIHVPEIIKEEKYHYGTRTSTVVLVGHDNRAHYSERNLDTSTRTWSVSKFNLTLES